jgi:hypothetical protein
MFLQVAVEAAKKLEAQALKQAEELQQEKTSLELEASDLRRQCVDLRQKASTLTVRPSPSDSPRPLISPVFEYLLFACYGQKDSKVILSGSWQSRHFEDLLCIRK